MILKAVFRSTLALAVISMGAASLPASAELTREQETRLKAAVAGIVIANAIRKAKKKRDREREWERYERDGRTYYNYDWGRSFSPHKDVVCYQRTRQCFKDRRYSSKWTARAFGY